MPLARREISTTSTHGWHRQKHDDELFLAKDRMSDQSVGKAGETTPPSFEEGRVG